MNIFKPATTTLYECAHCTTFTIIGPQAQKHIPFLAMRRVSTFFFQLTIHSIIQKANSIIASKSLDKRHIFLENGNVLSLHIQIKLFQRVTPNG